MIYMKKFWSYIENGRYCVGCTGQAVYVYDKDGNELAKFKDLPYAYTPAFSPSGDFFIVKTTEGRLAVYATETLSLIKKFRYSKVDYSQDDGFCFSLDGKYFINLERHGDSTCNGISIYNTADFSCVSHMLLDKNMGVSQIEAADGEYFVLGFMRGGEYLEFFVGKFADGEVKDLLQISQQEHDLYDKYLRLKANGFTDKAYQWSYCKMPLEKIKSADFSLAKLWKHYTDN